MKNYHRARSFIYHLLPAACCLLPAACCLLPAAHARQFYVKAGVLGVGLGYAHSVMDKFSVRAEFTSLGMLKRAGAIQGRVKGIFNTSYKLEYKAALQSNQSGIYGDWFPFANGFRLSSGLQIRKQEVRARGRLTATGHIGKIPIFTYTDDTVAGRVEFPVVAPYLGIGWEGGHDMRKGFGFVFDLGASFGKPSTRLTIGPDLEKLIKIDKRLKSALAADRKRLAAQAGKLKILPQLYVGIFYRF